MANGVPVDHGYYSACGVLRLVSSAYWEVPPTRVEYHSHPFTVQIHLLLMDGSLLGLLAPCTGARPRGHSGM